MGPGKIPPCSKDAGEKQRPPWEGGRASAHGKLELVSVAVLQPPWTGLPALALGPSWAAAGCFLPNGRRDCLPACREQN